MTTPGPGTEDQAAAAAPNPPQDPTPVGTAAAAAVAQLVQFYDSVKPWLIPSADAAALYYDGLYGTAGRGAAHLFRLVRWITVTGDALHCGIADYEVGNPVFSEAGILRGWAEYRISHNRRARVYVQRSLAARALAELGQAARDPRCQFWIPTGDNRTWTAEQLAADLATNWAAPIPASQIWANQNVPGGTWDRSDLFGTW